jgi:hypothetical protein
MSDAVYELRLPDNRNRSTNRMTSARRASKWQRAIRTVQVDRQWRRHWRRVAAAASYYLTSRVLCVHRQASNIPLNYISFKGHFLFDQFIEHLPVQRNDRKNARRMRLLVCRSDCLCESADMADVLTCISAGAL